MLRLASQEVIVKSFLRQTAIDVLTSLVKDDVNAEGVLREYLGVIYGERSNMMQIDMAMAEGIQPADLEFDFVHPDLVALIGENEKRDEEWFEKHLVTTANPELAKKFVRVDKPVESPETHSFIVRHFEDGVWSKHPKGALEIEPCFRPATVEESLPFMRKKPLFMEYFSVAILGSEWRHAECEIPAHAHWRKGKLELHPHRALGERDLLLMVFI
jgi:hypothetical protein